jgi:iron complex outermembrane receptor protein
MTVLLLGGAHTALHAQPAPSDDERAPPSVTRTDEHQPPRPLAPSGPRPVPIVSSSRPCDVHVDGHVVDAASHEPIASADVHLDGGYVGVTDEAGRFELSGLCTGVATVEVGRADYAAGQRTLELAGDTSLELELTAQSSEIIVVAGEAPTPVDMRSTAEVSGDALERTRGRGFSEALADVPGVSQLRSASGMAKPIVRGQYGRRLLILVNGVRHRAQEWGLDHAPEIDPFVADRLTVVRGASGVRYGPDAIGGAVLADPPALSPTVGIAGEAHVIGMSNGHGGNVAGRLQGTSARMPALTGRVEGSIKRLAAPSTPDYPLDNTGSQEWSVGTSAGYRRGGVYELSYLHYQAELGVCGCLRIESADEFFAQIERARPAGVELYRSDFEIERSYQAVAHDLVLGRGTWDIGALGTLTATYAFQHDLRREYEIVREATTGPQFRFRLLTHDGDVAFDHRPLHVTEHLHVRGSAGLVGMVQDHAYSGLPLVPDHTSWSTGAYLSERLVGHDFEIEAGLRYDVMAREASIERQDFLRLVRSDQLAPDACGGGAGDPVSCASTFHTVSASLGALRQLTSAWSVKLDLSTASRPPNPDEQYLNGTAPTFPVLGLGKPDLGPETTYSGSATTTLQSPRVTAELSAYANVIDDYIYFAPAIDENGEPIFDVLIRGTFPRFVTRPVDALFYGTDGGISATPVPWLELGGQFSLVRARDTSNDAPLVFIPPDRFQGSITYKAPDRWSLRKTHVSVSGSYTRRQHRFDPVADFARPPEGYFLVGGEIGTETSLAGYDLAIALQGTNLLDTRYREYTSLLRYFADQPGRQLMLRLSIHFSSLEPR